MLKDTTAFVYVTAFARAMALARAMAKAITHAYAQEKKDATWRIASFSIKFNPTQDRDRPA